MHYSSLLVPQDNYVPEAASVSNNLQISSKFAVKCFNNSIKLITAHYYGLTPCYAWDLSDLFNE